MKHRKDSGQDGKTHDFKIKGEDERKDPGIKRRINWGLERWLSA